MATVSIHSSPSVASTSTCTAVVFAECFLVLARDVEGLEADDVEDKVVDLFWIDEVDEVVWIVAADVDRENDMLDEEESAKSGVGEADTVVVKVVDEAVLSSTSGPAAILSLTAFAYREDQIGF